MAGAWASATTPNQSCSSRSCLIRSDRAPPSSVCLIIRLYKPETVSSHSSLGIRRSRPLQATIISMEDIQLPADVLLTVVSVAARGPRDACRVATVSPAFRAAADSDAVWSRFLPSDLAPLPYPEPAPRSKKDLFLRLSATHALLADGLVSAWLDRESGAKCCMVAARAMSICWADVPEYWRWITHADSRFQECIELLAVCWLDIRGEIASRMLSEDTWYAAYLVFKMADDFYGLDSPFQEASITIGEETSTHPARLQSYTDYNEEIVATDEAGEVVPRLPHERPDGWMELEIGDWYNSGGDNGVVRASVKETRMGGNWKKGLIVQGLEIRTKN